MHVTRIFNPSTTSSPQLLHHLRYISLYARLQIYQVGAIAKSRWHSLVLDDLGEIVRTLGV